MILSCKGLYRCLLVLAGIVVLLSIADLLYLMSQMVMQWQLMEPAENENLVLTWALTKGFSNTPGGLLAHGILPIYPDLYHRTSALLPLPPQVGGRVVTIIMYVGALVCIAMYAKKKTDSWLLAGLFSILMFGHPTHGVYFLMQRVDAFFICMGTLSLILIWWDFELDKDLLQSISALRTWRCIASGFLLGCALLSKQTALLFVLIHCVPFVVSWITYRRIQGLKQLSIIALLSGTTIALYWLLVNRSILDDSLLGIHIFGSHPWVLGTLHTAIQKYEAYVFFDDGYFYYVTAFFMALLLTLRVSNLKHALVGLACCILVVTITLRTWLNDAAFFNNFIFISLFGVLLTLYFWPKDNLIKKTIIIIRLLVCAVFSYVGIKTDDLRALLDFQPTKLFTHIDDFSRRGSYRYVFAKELENSSGEDSILTYIHEHPGPYISTRLDNYLIDAGRDVEFEGSVLGAFVYDHNDITLYTKNAEVVAGVENLRAQLHEKIRDQYFEGVLIGLPIKEFLKEFPEFLTNYTLHDSRKIVQGNSVFKALLYVKKNAT
jgi:hypothetical protein